MITIKINGKKVQIPRFNELTVKQYKELIPFIADSGQLDPLRYVSVTTGNDYEKSLRFEIKGIRLLNEALGIFKFICGDVDACSGIEYIESSKPARYFEYDGRVRDVESVRLNAVGYRILVEQYLKERPTYLDMYIYMLACVLTNNFDYEEVMETVEKLQSENAYKVLITGAFFFYKWKRKESGESWSLRMLRRVLMTSMRLRRRRLVLIDLKSTGQ